MHFLYFAVIYCTQSLILKEQKDIADTNNYYYAQLKLFIQLLVNNSSL